MNTRKTIFNMKIEREILYRYFNGKATQEEEQQIKQYIEESSNHWEEYLRERKYFDTIILKHRTPSAAQMVKRRLHIHRFVKESIKIAAVAIIAFATAFFWSQSMEQPSQKSIVSTLQGQMANVQLPDGTHVWLNSNTRLEYPEHFADDERRVVVDGEAYFEVFHNAKQPFIVKTSRSEIEVLGTKFYVEDYAGSDVFETALIEGSVKVVAANHSLLLTPDYKATIRNGKMIAEKIEDYDIYRWREGLICFKSKPFAEILREFEKYYGMKIVMGNGRVSNPTLTGKFRLTDGLEYALQVLQRDVKFTYTRDDDKNMITIN